MKKTFVTVLILFFCLLTGCKALFVSKDNEMPSTNEVEEIKSVSLESSVQESSVSSLSDDIDELLLPYQKVLDRLNAEYGYRLFIPDDYKESVYNAYKNMTPEEFEALMYYSLLQEKGWEQ